MLYNKTIKYLFLLTIIICFSNNIFAHMENREYAKAKIIDIKKNEVSTNDSLKIVETKFELLILTGRLKGEHRTAVFKGEDNMPVDVKYKVGNKIFIGIDETNYDENTTEYISLYDIDNNLPLIILFIITFIVVLLIGRIKGILSVLSLVITIGLIFFILIPLTLKGFSPLLLSILVAFLSTVITIPVIAGINFKSLSAIIGSISGILAATILALIFGNFLHLSGIITNDMMTIYYAMDNPEIVINLKHLALSGMIIAALGAVMDVTISISSSAQEIFKIHPEVDAKDAFNSVMNIGKDILGSMVNTLILAYVGSSISLILLITIKFDRSMPLSMIFNYNPVLSEIVKSLIGSMGMFLSIPITAVISVRLFSYLSKKDKTNIL